MTIVHDELTEAYRILSLNFVFTVLFAIFDKDLAMQLLLFLWAVALWYMPTWRLSSIPV